MAPSATSSLFLNTSRDGDSTSSLGRLLQYFITLSVKIFSNIQPVSSLAQLETVPSRSVGCCLETNPYLTATTFQGVVESDKVTPESPFLEVEQRQLPQLFLTGFVFPAPPQPRCLLWMRSSVSTSFLN